MIRRWRRVAITCRWCGRENLLRIDEPRKRCWFCEVEDWQADEADDCTMCRQQPATTTWGLPVCQFCADWLTRLDRDLKEEFGHHLTVPVERYIDRARRAIRQRRLDEAALSSDERPRPVAAGTDDG